MAKIKFKIITPEKIVFEDNEVDVLVIPTKEGEITYSPIIFLWLVFFLPEN